MSDSLEKPDIDKVLEYLNRIVRVKRELSNQFEQAEKETLIYEKKLIQHIVDLVKNGINPEKINILMDDLENLFLEIREIKKQNIRQRVRIKDIEECNPHLKE